MYSYLAKRVNPPYFRPMKRWLLPLVVAAAVAAGGLIFWLGHRSTSVCRLPATEALKHPELLKQFHSDSPVAGDLTVRSVEFAYFLEHLYLEVSLFELGRAPESAFAGDTLQMQKFRTWVGKYLSAASMEERQRLLPILKQILIWELKKVAGEGRDTQTLFETRLKRMNSMFEKESAYLSGFFCLIP